MEWWRQDSCLSFRVSTINRVLIGLRLKPEPTEKPARHLLWYPTFYLKVYGCLVYGIYFCICHLSGSETVLTSLINTLGAVKIKLYFFIRLDYFNCLRCRGLCRSVAKMSPVTCIHWGYAACSSACPFCSMNEVVQNSVLYASFNPCEAAVNRQTKQLPPSCTSAN